MCVCAKANCEWLYLYDRPHWAIAEPVNAKGYARCASSNFNNQTDSLAHRSLLNIQNSQQKKIIHHFYVCVPCCVWRSQSVSNAHAVEAAAAAARAQERFEPSVCGSAVTHKSFFFLLPHKCLQLYFLILICLRSSLRCSHLSQNAFLVLMTEPTASQ